MKPISERSCLGVLLAAGEGTRMRSARRSRCTRSPAARCSPMRWPRSVEAGCDRIAVVVGPGAGGEALAAAPRARSSPEARFSCKANGAAPPMPCSPPARRLRARRRRARALRRHAAADRRDVAALREGLGGKTAVVALGFEAAEPDGLRALHRARRRARRDPRGEGRQRGGAGDPPLQRRHGGDRGRARAANCSTGARRQRRARILPHRPRRDRRRGAGSRAIARMAGRRGGDGRQRPRAARRRRGRDAAQLARAGDARRRDADRAGDGVPVAGHRARPRRRRSSRMSCSGAA